jgi:hypothetical protein
MTSHQTNRRNQSSPLAAGISGAILGGASGLLIGASYDGGRGALIGGLLGALYFGLVEGITHARRRPGELKPLWHRLIGSVIVGAATGALLGGLFSSFSPIVIGLIVGGLAGLTGLGPRKLALGLASGLAVGLLATIIGLEPFSAVVGGGTILVYRLALLLLFPGSAPVTLSGERVDPAEARYVVPFEAHTGYIGAGYMESLARESDGTFKRNKPGIGIVETMEALRGPHFDPALVNPLIREFYEHTSRFKLSIEPEWNPFMRPFFWLFKNFVASKIGQANLPFNTEEAQRGMVSYIDTIDYEGDGESGFIRTIRGWIRAYEGAGGEAIYVGVYTVVRHDEIGYVSVGFPLPEANFTATLLPYNNREGDFLLTTRDTGPAFPGHYLSDIDNEDGSLTILKLPTMGEEIDVFVDDGRLKTDHSFYFGGYRFLTLHYTMERVPE